MNKRLKVMLFTVIPIVVLCVISLFTKQPDINKGLGIFWLIAGDVWIMAIIIGIIFWLRKNREIALGILAGAAIGFASLALTVIILIALHQPG